MITPTNEVLFDLVKEGDRRAFDVLYDRYWALVYKTAFTYLKDSEASMEIVNDIFLNIWVKRHKLNILAFEPYISSAARYRVYNHLRLRKKQPTLSLDNFEMLPVEPIVSNDAELALHTNDIHKKLSVLLSALPARCREIFVLSRFEHLSNSEIAAKLSVSKRTVENQLSLALQHLRNNVDSLILALLALNFIFSF